MTRAADPRARVLLVAGQLRDDEAQRVLAPAGFLDPRAAAASLRRMAGSPQEELALAGLLSHLLTSLGSAAGPDAVLVSFERFVRGTDDRLALLRRLREHPRAIEVLVTLFSGSQFLTEILLRHPTAFAGLAEPRRLARPKGAARLLAEARAELARAGAAPEALDALRRLQRLELLRIGACDLLGLLDLATVTAELSALADALVQACLDLSSRETATDPAGFAVLGMGKLGGQELNYSSDIDLVFVARGNATAYWALGKRLIDALARATSEGFLYRVDMRLRPWGDAGALVSSIDATLGYLERNARLWEKQALLKARAIAGDAGVGEEVLARAQPLLFAAPAGEVRDAVHAMKQKTERLLRAKGEELAEVKLGEGSIRDVEFVVQYLQLAHGGARPSVRSRTTLDALARLLAEGILPPDEGRVLSEGYLFLRTVEHHLQVMHYRQTHLLPRDPRALGELARRLGFQGEGAGERFQARHREHRAAVRALYTKHLGGEKMATTAEPRPAPESPRARVHAARMDPSYTATFDDEEIQRHAALAATLGDERLVAVDAVDLPECLRRVTVVSFDYPGELSLICGLLFAHGFSIQQAEAFTYEPVEAAAAPGPRVPLHRPGPRFFPDALPRRRPSRPPEGADARRKTVDVFTVKPLRDAVAPDVWETVARDLETLLRLMRDGRRQDARGEIARRAAVTQQALAGARTPLLPVDIEVDNEASERYTVLRIDAPDTAGFLYELTNALALRDVYIARLTAGPSGSRVHDTLWVTDASGAKITSEARQRELRAATALVKHFTHLLPHAPDPRLALLHFGELVGQLFSRPDWLDQLASLESPKVLDALAQLLGVSDFLWTDFLRMQHANLFPVVTDLEGIASPVANAELRAALGTALAGAATPEAWRDALNAWKDRELFRIDMRQVLGRTEEFDAFAGELGDLAEIVVDAAFRRVLDELTAPYGAARLPDGSPCGIAVCALGKCGGREMGFASDIELLFVYRGDGQTDGPQRIGAAELTERLVQSFAGAIRTKREGVFEVDLRLRPYGSAGSMAVSLDAFRRYFARSGPAWAYERQALIRLRPVAGDPALGEDVVRLRDELVYDGEPVDVPALRAMRERQLRQIVQGGTFNAKFSPGGLVDVEYLVQALQMRHGVLDPRVRATNTRAAMAALAEAGVLPEADHTRLRKAQTFLRWVVEALRVVRGNARDVTIPRPESDEFAYLARRMRSGDAPDRLLEELRKASGTVQELVARHLG